MQSGDEVELAFEAGKAAWPKAALSLERFVRRITEREIRPQDLASHGGDLYLAYACAEGDPGALAHFEEAFIKNVDLYIARSGVPHELTCEVRQKVRVKLLVGSSPGIGGYRAEGPLSGLVRVTAVRVAVDVAAAATAAGKHSPDQEILDLLVSSDINPEVAAAKALYRDRFRAAVEESLAGLQSREKTILRLHVVDGLSIDGIGAIYRVHRATVARWLVAIRNGVIADLRKRLALHLGASPSEVRSLVQLLRDDIDVSAKRILGATSR
jgi:RNA polymerase sigma-70 factor (ECF subfamily)